MAHASLLGSLVHLYCLGVVHTELLLGEYMFSSGDGSKCDRGMHVCGSSNDDGIDGWMQQQVTVFREGVCHTVFLRALSQEIGIDVTERYNLRLWAESQPGQMNVATDTAEA